MVVEAVELRREETYGPDPDFQDKLNDWTSRGSATLSRGAYDAWDVSLRTSSSWERWTGRKGFQAASVVLGGSDYQGARQRRRRRLSLCLLFALTISQSRTRIRTLGSSLSPNPDP